MIIRHFERLRGQPKSVRDRYAFLVAAVFTGLVAVVWVTALPGRFSEVASATGENATGTQPFGLLFTHVKKQFATVRGALQKESTTTPEVVSSEDGSIIVKDPRAIVLTPEEIAAVDTTPYTPPASTTGRVVHIISSTEASGTSSLASSTTAE